LPSLIWRRVAAYLPRLLVGERTLEVVVLLLCSTLGASRWPRPPLAPSGIEAGAASPAASAAACSSGTGEEGPSPSSAWIRRAAAYLPRLLVGERALGLLLPRRLPAGRGPCCTRASKEDAKRVERS